MRVWGGQRGWPWKEMNWALIGWLEGSGETSKSSSCLGSGRADTAAASTSACRQRFESRNRVVVAGCLNTGWAVPLSYRNIERGSLLEQSVDTRWRVMSRTVSILRGHDLIEMPRYYDHNSQHYDRAVASGGLASASA
jgi:hypothetical protein